MLVLRRIHVHYRVAAPRDSHEQVARLHAVHMQYCPVYRSLQAAIAITTSFELV